MNTQQLQARLSHLSWQTQWRWQGDANHMIHLLTEAIDIANQLEMTAQSLEMRHRLALVYLDRLQEVTHALPMLVELVVEARHPAYQAWASQICLPNSLVSALSFRMIWTRRITMASIKDDRSVYSSACFI